MQSNKEEALNLYAKVEDLLGVQDVAPTLNSYYYDILSQFNFNSLLDIGCGKGEFLRKLRGVEPSVRLLGIDRSSLMIEETKLKGIDAKVADIKEIREEFDIATAVFDMVNYLNPKEIDEFFEQLSMVVKKGGYFIFDINTLFGLSELAVGNFIAQDEDRFVTIESFFEDNIYESFWTLFERKNGNIFKKSSQEIRQYYYDEDFFLNLKSWKVIKTIPISLYGEESIDKEIFVLHNIRA